MSPWTLKIIYGIIVDQKIVSKRAYYIFTCGVIASALNFVVAAGLCEHAKSTVIVLFLSNIANAFIDVTMESLVIEQARKDSENGQ